MKRRNEEMKQATIAAAKNSACPLDSTAVQHKRRLRTRSARLISDVVDEEHAAKPKFRGTEVLDSEEERCLANEISDKAEMHYYESMMRMMTSKTSSSSDEECLILC